LRFTKQELLHTISGYGVHMKIFVTGGAGFIGSNLIGRLVDEGHEVTAYDNLSLGKKELIEPYLKMGRCRFVHGDLLNTDMLQSSLPGNDLVVHLAANSDIGYGARITDVDLTQGTIATYNVLEAMRICDIHEIIFASTSAVYGLAAETPTPEDYGPLFPISLYGASKLACEGLITAFSHNFGMKSWIFRFANIVGINGTHGALYDFILKLKKDRTALEILGDGKQAKPYLHVSECIDGMLYGYRHSKNEVNCFNLTGEGVTSVVEIADIITGEAGLSDVKYIFTGGTGGSAGDVPFVIMNGTRLADLGWKAKLHSREAVMHAARELLQQLWK
jgi:UDP-glucose 4-epimerase